MDRCGCLFEGSRGRNESVYCYRCEGVDVDVGVEVGWKDVGLVTCIFMSKSCLL